MTADADIRLAAGLQSLGLGLGAWRQLARFCELLSSEAIPRGFLGPSEGERLIERHVLESAAMAPRLASGALIDVGSGAGLPGVVLACLRHGSTTLLDSDAKRVAFLNTAVRALEVDATVVCGRAEEVARDDEFRDRFDVGVARALASPAVALELVTPFVRVGGHCALAVGPSVDEEAVGYAARELGGGKPRFERLEVPGLQAERRAMIVEKIRVTPDRYPRRTGVPSRRPLGGRTD